MSEKIWFNDAWEDYLYWQTQDNDLNDAAKQRTLQYARGNVLDAIGERVGADDRKWAEENGIIRGDADGAKRYESFITREEAAVMLHRTAKL